MRPWFRWLLAVSAFISAVALWWPENVVQAVARSGAEINGSQASTEPRSETAAQANERTPALPPLPEYLPAPALDKTDFDPFRGLQPPPPPPPAPIPVPVVVAPPPPAPTAPPLTYRYLGQMTDPSGKRLVYLVKADKDVLVAAGMQLDEGYVVDAITVDSIQLRYPPLDSRAVISIPETTDSVIR